MDFIHTDRSDDLIEFTTKLLGESIYMNYSDESLIVFSLLTYNWFTLDKVSTEESIKVTEEAFMYLLNLHRLGILLKPENINSILNLTIETQE